MRILVTTASEHGATTELAGRAGAGHRGRGPTAEAAEPDNNRSRDSATARVDTRRPGQETGR
ncbi:MULTISPECIES: hypothetical protein [unclassified Rhodococcus (in: high G+C Gram-positive bacteria)]|uniref:hypothetical protein n=1 Tax=unclassified Rhodococcus (in: high G+C Gram-positive bacteria) TaxID=192944 RepID=UPI00031AC459|nr:hypothetical protein [Rhodococcus sp. DK17]